MTPFCTLPLIPSHEGREETVSSPLMERIKSKIPPKAGVRVSKGSELPAKVNLTTIFKVIQIAPVLLRRVICGKRTFTFKESNFFDSPFHH